MYPYTTGPRRPEASGPRRSSWDLSEMALSTARNVCQDRTQCYGELPLTHGQNCRNESHEVQRLHYDTASESAKERQQTLHYIIEYDLVIAHVCSSPTFAQIELHTPVFSDSSILCACTHTCIYDVFFSHMILSNIYHHYNILLYMHDIATYLTPSYNINFIVP